jgi:diguanylate cyclase (GGDEF)-like protein
MAELKQAGLKEKVVRVGPLGRNLSGPSRRLAASKVGSACARANLAGVWEVVFFSRPSLVAAFFWLAGAVACLQAALVHRWPASSSDALVAVAALAVACAVFRASIGQRLRPWTLHCDVALANSLVTISSAVAATGDVNLANLYLLVEVFALLYLPLRPALAHLAFAATAYGIVLSVGPHLEEPALLAWSSVFGTALVLGTVITGLTSALRHIAKQDHLTKLPNRRAWDERLASELQKAARTRSALSVVVLDLDGFKQVNDNYGHHAGDRLLRAAASAWRAVTREEADFLARLGGDEFGLIAPGADGATARRLAQRLVEALPGALSASFGVASWDFAEGPSSLTHRADHDMYQSKRSRGQGVGPPALEGPRATFAKRRLSRGLHDGPPSAASSRSASAKRPYPYPGAR